MHWEFLKRFSKIFNYSGGELIDSQTFSSIKALINQSKKYKLTKQKKKKKWNNLKYKYFHGDRLVDINEWNTDVKAAQE